MNLLNDMVELNDNLRLVDQLNKLLFIDPELTKALVNTRYPVSQAYIESYEFTYMQDSDTDIPTAGLVGVLNGLVLNSNKFRIAAYYDDNNELTEFQLLELQGKKFVKVNK